MTDKCDSGGQYGPTFDAQATFDACGIRSGTVGGRLVCVACEAFWPITGPTPSIALIPEHERVTDCEYRRSAWEARRKPVDMRPSRA